MIKILAANCENHKVLNILDRLKQYLCQQLVEAGFNSHPNTLIAFVLVALSLNLRFFLSALSWGSCCPCTFSANIEEGRLKIIRDNLVKLYYYLCFLTCIMDVGWYRYVKMID